MLNAKSYLHKPFRIRKKLFLFLSMVLCAIIIPFSAQANGFWNSIKQGWEDAKYSSETGVRIHFDRLVSKNQYQFNDEEKKNINRSFEITNIDKGDISKDKSLSKKFYDFITPEPIRAVSAGTTSTLWEMGKRVFTGNDINDVANSLDNHERMTNALAEAIVRSDVGQAYAAMIQKGMKLQNSESDAYLAVHEEVKKLLRTYANDATTEDGLAKAINDVQKNLYDRTVDMLKTYDENKTAQMNDEAALAEATQTEVKAVEIKKCVLVSELKLKYQSGCYSCFIVGNLISTFLDVAGKVYPTSQKAGLIVLLIGTLIWLAMWGLKNVSSLTQIDGGNILNDLIKFSFKVMLAYLFITAGVSFVGKYIINPIMGTGATIAQQFWDERFKEDVVDFAWDGDVYITDNSPLVKESEELEKKRILETSAPAQQTPIPQAQDVQEGATTGEIEPIDPNSSDEQLVIALQKAFLNMLRRQIGEIMNSCGGACGSKCRTSGCTSAKSHPNYKGHYDYVSDIFCWAGMCGTNTAYCQASITAAINKMLKEVTESDKAYKNLQIPLTGTPPHSGGDINFCSGGKLKVKLSPGDIIGIHANDKGDSFGKYSGHHAITITDPSKPTFISFNGDTPEGKNFCTWYHNPRGKVFSVSDWWRKKLKENPNLKKELKLNRLAEMGAGINMSFINYSGDYSSISSDGGSIGAPTVTIPEFEYKATAAAKAIMSESVIKSILGATKVITSTLAENMVLGNALTCYATLDKGGAWHIGTEILGISFNFGFITNWFLWIEGAIIWVSGFLLTMAVAYYLLDVCFKIGFAVIALPIVVGLWPFEMTKKKFSSCISIIAKSAATFAFLAMTASYGIKLISSVLSGGENAMGLEKIYQAIDAASSGTGESGDENVQYVMSQMDLFSINFVLLMFAIIYTFKLVGATVQKLVSKFFPDNFFGEQQPMHHNLTAVTKAAKDLAMKPVGMARDIAMHQTGKLAVGAVKAAAHPVRTAKTVGNSVKKGLNKAKGIFK